MVEAIIELIHAAMEKERYDRYIIISDDSMPIVEMQELRRRIELDVDYVDLGAVPAAFQSRYERFYMFDSEATQVRWIPVIDREFSDDALSRIERLSALRKTGKKPVPTVFYGSQWMSLTAPSVQCILDSWNEDHWLRESFEFSEVPDEGYFHTILGQNLRPSPRPLMHVEWTGSPPPRVFTTAEELSAITSATALFVRKVNMAPEQTTLWTEFLLDPMSHRSA